MEAVECGEFNAGAARSLQSFIVIGLDDATRRQSRSEQNCAKNRCCPIGVRKSGAGTRLLKYWTRLPQVTLQFLFVPLGGHPSTTEAPLNTGQVIERQGGGLLDLHQHDARVQARDAGEAAKLVHQDVRISLDGGSNDAK